MAQVLLAVILQDSDWFELFGIGFFSDFRGEGGKAVVIVVVMVSVGTVPSPCFDNMPHVVAVIDLLPEVDRGSVVKAALKWSLAMRPCTTLVARLASRLLYFLFIVATRGRVALAALATVVPPVPGASSGVPTDQRSFTTALRPRGHVPSGRHWMLPIKLHERAQDQILQHL
jgi:hypothetical protein